MKDNKKRKIAIALKYEIEENAPKVIGKGIGEVAQKIIESAKIEDIQNYKDEGLANELLKVNIGDEIPDKLYTTVASVLAFIYELDEKKRF